MERNSRGSIDTNILLRLVLNDVPAQSLVVRKLLSRHLKYEVADLAITETAFVLEKFYKMERELVVQYLYFIVRHSSLVSNKNLFEYVLPLYASENSLSINDCVLLGYARFNKKTPLYTFDKKLVSKSGGDAVHP